MSSVSRLLYRSFCTAVASTTSTPSINSMKGIVNDLFKERNLTKLVEKFKQSAESYRFRTKHRVYQTTVRRLAGAKRFSMVEEILEDQKKYHDITKEGFAIRLISLYGKAGMVDHASKTFDQLPELKCERTVKSFNALLSAYIDSKNFDKVEGLFREYPSKFSLTPDDYSYTITIQALCNLGSLDSALELLDEMEKNGLTPNLVTFNTLFHAFYEGGRLSDAEKLWARMEKKEIVPEIRSYNSKLRGLVLAGKVSEAAKLIEDLKTKEPKPDVFSYNALLKGYCKDGKVDDAKKVYDEMLEFGCVENRWTYETLIPALCVKDDYDFALKLATKSISANCYIDAGLLQLVAEGLVKQSKMDDAKNLVALARKKSYSRNKVKLSTKNSKVELTTEDE